MMTPDELKISQSEYDALLKTRDQLKGGCLVHQELDLDDELGALGPARVRQGTNGASFNMLSAGLPHTCGTVACIGGWMQINMSLAAGTISDPLDSTITGLARRYVDNKLGEPIGKLFFPQLPPPMWNDITHEQAIQAIDNFLENGNPRWATIMKERT